MVKAKKVKAKKDVSHHLHLGIVAIVAVVAIVILVLNYTKWDVAGEAIRISRTAATSTSTSCAGCEKKLMNAQADFIGCQNKLSSLCDVGATLSEGESKTFSVPEKYEVTLMFIDDKYAEFIVNGVSTKKMVEGESGTLVVPGEKYEVTLMFIDGKYAKLIVNGVTTKKFIINGYSTKKMMEGESETLVVPDKKYEVTLMFIDNNYTKFIINGYSTKKFIINGYSTKKMMEGESETLPDGTMITLLDNLYQSSAGNQATFCLNNVPP
ncbi:MAG: hypothetical protein AB1668_02110 [Nanoarchaeota archaeon]